MGGLLVKRGVVDEKSDSMETADSERKVDNKKLHDLLHLPGNSLLNSEPSNAGKSVLAMFLLQ